MILNVDDDEARLFTRNSWLQGAKYEVISAKTGSEAIDLALRHHPEAILLDVHLPDIGGTEVCRRLKARAEFRATPVILISALFRSPHDQLEGLNEGALFYLTEPVTRETLLDAVRRALG